MRYSLLRKLPVALAMSAVLLTGCLGASDGIAPLKVTYEKATAKTAYADAKKLALQGYPDAVLIGFNNHGSTFARDYNVPQFPDSSPSAQYWFFFFAKTPAAFDDGVIKDEEAFGVAFQKQQLVLSEKATTQDWKYEKDNVIGDELLKFDTEKMFLEMLRTIDVKFGEKAIAMHLDFRFAPGTGELILFESPERGYFAHFNVQTGEVGYIEANTFR